MSTPSRPMRILYFGINAPTKSARDVVYIDALKARGATILECVDSSPGVKKFIGLYRTHKHLRGSYDAIFVGHMSTFAVPLAWLISRKPIIFNALNPLYDGMVLEREIYKKYSLGALGILIADFLSVHCATRTLLETNVQIEFVHRMFLVAKKKLVRVFTTVDPKTYAPDPHIKKSDSFLCVLRGYLTEATGTEYIVEAARILKDTSIRFRFIVRGPSLPKIEGMIAQYGLTNIELITAFQTPEDLHRLILEGHVYLGQFSNHSRLDRTIQFKTVEAMAFGLPYITADLPSNRELLHDGVDCLLVQRADAQDIAEKILLLQKDGALRERLGSAAHALYKKELAPDVLAEQIEAIAYSLI